VRYFIHFSYNGTHYHGWQTQPNAKTVQETLTHVLTTILDSKIQLMGAGRTDTGVHAMQMFAHFDYDLQVDDSKIIHNLNAMLPNDIVVFDIFEVKFDAHARFDATARTYQYHINDQKKAFSNDLSWYFSKKLDVDLMNQAAKLLIYHLDFECFSKTNTDVNTFICHVSEAFWETQNNDLVFTITADRFLRNMVRAIVGTLLNVGLHKISLTEFVEILHSKDRKKAGFSVPAHGLFLTKIAYPFV
jgi:tRNA pseudouridine38-40 synthase